MTLSEQQALVGAAARSSEAGLPDLAEVRHLDYRDVPETGFDAVSSIGLTEHIGRAQLPGYFAFLHGKLQAGRTAAQPLHHPAGRRLPGRLTGGFINRYVFPDGELEGPGHLMTAMNDTGFEVRHEENLREHYALTLADWCANLEAHWDEAVAEVGPGTARVWRLYMAASRLGFERNQIQLHQMLGREARARRHVGHAAAAGLGAGARRAPGPCRGVTREKPRRGVTREPLVMLAGPASAERGHKSGLPGPHPALRSVGCSPRPDGLPEDVLASALERGWQVAATSMAYRPVGFGSHHWEVTDAAGIRWFVTADDLETKRHTQGESREAAFGRLRASLAAARALRDEGCAFVVAPVPALDGEPLVRANHRFTVALYPFVDGQSFEWGAVHRARAPPRPARPHHRCPYGAGRCRPAGGN